VRTVVCAYGEVGHESLAELLALGVEVVLVVTHRDSPGERIWFRSVAELARSAGVPVVTPDDVNAEDAVRAIEAARPEILFSFYFRQMMRPRVLELASRGALNLHGSLLPRYRGRAPVNWALVRGESETGVTLHYMDEKPDHGDVVAQRRVAIARDDTALSLTRKLAAEARLLLRESVPLLAAGRAPRTPQDHAAATYFGGRRPEDGEIDWAKPAEEIRNLVRAVTDPWPGAFTSLGGRPVYVWWVETRPQARAAAPGTLSVDAAGRVLVATGDGALELCDVSWQGGERRSGAAWASAAGITGGMRFDEPPTGAGRPRERRQGATA
jgi:UDP-4-amino-4-deoxy-L-arabinose formyltransferase/UDP-glucuronic acid dehydrogenase (UDP-4-keto-hexauronic acid decarboxylating)